METFREIEQNFGKTLVRGVDAKEEINGFLTLAGKETVAQISAKNYVGLSKDRNGWFDLELVSEQGEQILLHNALTIEHSGRSPDKDGFNLKIFPNFVILNREYISKNKKVTEMSFKLDRLRNFFWYHNIEQHSLYGQEEEFKKALKRVRKTNARKYEYSRDETDYDFLDPDTIYVVHNSPKVLNFKLGNKSFGIWIGRTHSMGWGDINVETYPVGRILFHKAATIEEALDAVWQWRRFFSQVALEELLPTAIWGRHKSKEKHYYSKFYLPNIEDAKEDTSEIRSFHPGDVPLNQWAERKALKHLMRTWLEKEKDRHQFRVFLDHVISDRKKRSSLSDLVTLCAAIESLKDLKIETEVKKKDVKLVADAAVIAAKSTKIDKAETRIRNLLGNLKNVSLRAKMECVFKSANPNTSEENGKLLIDTILELRQIAAHGNPISELTFPKARPAVEALTAICVMYDLETSGLKISGNDDTRLTAKVALRQAMQELVHLNKFR